MPAASKRLRAPAELESEESKAHEAGESPEDEVREGSEDAPKAKTNRRRGAKNAKRTKAPMDSEGCGCGGKKGASCDGGCGSYAKKMDRSDALTPQEYLAACDLGIQGRSRAYIRARLDAAERLDLKCGKGSISEGEKCHVGAAQKAPGRVERRGLYGTSGLGGDPFSYKNMAKKGAALNASAAGAMGGAFGAAVGGRKGALIGAGIGAAYGALGGALGGAAQAGINRASSRAAKRSRLTQEFERPIAAQFKKSVNAERAKISRAKSRIAELDYKTSMKLAQGYDRIARETKGRYGADSVYASGFSLDTSTLGI